MKNYNYVWFGVLLCLGGCFWQQESTDKQVLIVGTCAGFPPYEVLNNEGQPDGFDIDVAKEIAQKMGKVLVVKDMGFDALVVALKQGRVDVILAGLSITKERLHEIAMVHYQGGPLPFLPILFWEKTPIGITCVDDLKTFSNKTVCVQVGTIQADIITQYSKKHALNLEIKYLENNADLLMDIKYGKSIAAVLEPLVVAALQQDLPEIKTLSLSLAAEEQGMGNGIGINKKNSILIKSIETIVADLKATGKIKELEKKWFNGGCHDSK